MTKEDFSITARYYGREVIQGRRVLPDEPNPHKLRTVPKRYAKETREFVEWVNEYLKEFEGTLNDE